MDQFMQCLKKISFLAYGYEANDDCYGVTDSAKVEFANGLGCFFYLRIKASVQVATVHAPTGHGSGRTSH